MGSSGGSDAPDTPRLSNPTSVQAILDSGVTGNIDGIFVYIDRPNADPQVLASGVQNRQTSEQATPEALFKIASISKLFIAVAATKLVEQNSLQMTDTLGMWLPELTTRIANAERITLEQMLAHRSRNSRF